MVNIAYQARELIANAHVSITINNKTINSINYLNTKLISFT